MGTNLQIIQMLFLIIFNQANVYIIKIIQDK